MPDSTLPATIPGATAAAVTLTADDAAAVHGFALAEKSAATRRAYRSDFAVFSAWCESKGFDPLPAAPAAVAAFLADQAATVRPSTLSRRVAAISYAHELAGLATPTTAQAVRVVLGGIRREKGAKPAQEVPSAHFRSAYEIYAHVCVAEQTGLSDDKLATIVAGQRPADLTHEEGVAYDVAACLVSGGVLPELTYRRAVEAFGQAETGELCYLVGLYCLVAVTLNAFNVPVPEQRDDA